MARRPAWIGILGVLALIALGPGLLDWAWIAWHRHWAARRVAELAARHAQLADEQRRLTSDPLYVEDLARSTLKISKKGEVVVPLASSSRR